MVIVLKHMILLKQNRWPPEIYNNYMALLKRDYLLTTQYNFDLDISFLFLLFSFCSLTPADSCSLRTNRRKCDSQFFVDPFYCVELYCQTTLIKHWNWNARYFLYSVLDLRMYSEGKDCDFLSEIACYFFLVVFRFKSRYQLC